MEKGRKFNRIDPIPYLVTPEMIESAEQEIIDRDLAKDQDEEYYIGDAWTSEQQGIIKTRL